MKWPLITQLIEQEDDIVAARQRARGIAEQLGFNVQDQTRIATAVSEIARNAFGYAGGGKVDFALNLDREIQTLVIRVSDRGPGMVDLDAIMEGRYKSTTGLGLGIVGARRLVDGFDITSSAGDGTTVTLIKQLPSASPSMNGSKVAALVEAMAKSRPKDPRAALRDQNRELLRSLSELAEREEEAIRLNRELAETNRGVVALYAELETQAMWLREAGATLESQVAVRTAELAEANDRLRAEAAERERMEADLRQSQKMEAVGQLTGGIAHDFNNLLTGIIGSLDLMKVRMAKGQTTGLDRYMDGALTSANRAAALTHRLLAFARRQPLDPTPTDANALIVGMTDLLRRTISEAIELKLDAPEDLWLTLCDPHQLENAILNLAINARDAMPHGGTLEIQTCNGNVTDAPWRKTTEMSAEYIRIRVADTGVGMPPDVIAKAFDPFFTTKPIGQGTGLGLSMIYGFALQSNGHAQIESEVGKGTAITLFLPRCVGRPSALQDKAAAIEMQWGDGETVLVVEDEQVVRDLIVEALLELGYKALQATDGLAGLRILESAERVDLLVTDVGLPVLNGRQLADHARVRRPDLKVLFMTGYAETAASSASFLGSGMAMMTKPFAVDAFMQRVRAMIAREN